MSDSEGFLGGLIGKAKEFGEKAGDFAEDAIDKAKELAGDLPENAKKFADEAGTAVKDFAADFPENAKKAADEATTAIKGLLDGDDKPAS